MVLLALLFLVFRLATRHQELGPIDVLIGGTDGVGVYEVVSTQLGCDPRPVDREGFRTLTWNAGNGPVVRRCENAQDCAASLLDLSPGVLLPTPPLDIATESTVNPWDAALRIPTYLRAVGGTWVGELRHMVCADERCITLERGSQVHRDGDDIVVVTTLLHAEHGLDAMESDDWRTEPLVCVAREEVRLSLLTAD